MRAQLEDLKDEVEIERMENEELPSGLEQV